MRDEPIRPTRRNHHGFLRWHRRIGVTLAILIAAIVLTGVALNHSEALGLRRTLVQADWLYRWYGMLPDDVPRGYVVGDSWIVTIGQSVFVGDQRAMQQANVVGAVSVSDMIVVASSNEVVLLTANARVIERLTGNELPPDPILAVGRADLNQHVIVRTARGLYAAGPDFLEWKPPAGPSEVVWSEAASVPPALAEVVQASYRGEALNLERVLLDLHTGRFFGGAGAFALDVVAIGVLFLIATGIWYLVATRRSSR